MNELERLIDRFGTACVDQVIFGPIYLEKEEQAKQAILDYIEENYRRKDD